jgi:hypothetical protein
MKLHSYALTTLAITLSGTLPAMSASGIACDVDIEGLPAGTIVTELSVGAGISGCAETGTIGVESQNTLFSSEAAIVFDSDCPVIPDPFSDCGPADLDLGTPNETFGGPGVGAGGEAGQPFENDTALGKVLVLAKDKVDSNDDGLVDDPDDLDAPGYFDFDFSTFTTGNKGVQLDAVTLLDIEFDEGESPAEIVLTRKAGPPVVLTQVDTGNNGVTTIEQIGIEDVTSMRVNLKGSSALAGFVIDSPELVRSCWATFGGFHSAFTGPSDDKIASFGGNVGPPPSGHLNIVKHATGEHLRISDVVVESCVVDEAVCPNSGGPGQPGGKKGFDINRLNFVGTGDLDGVDVPVSGSIIDCGEPQGKKAVDHDQFIVIADGVVFIDDVLAGGNAQLHPPVGKP